MHVALRKCLVLVVAALLAAAPALGQSSEGSLPGTTGLRLGKTEATVAPRAAPAAAPRGVYATLRVRWNKLDEKERTLRLPIWLVYSVKGDKNPLTQKDVEAHALLTTGIDAEIPLLVGQDLLTKPDVKVSYSWRIAQGPLAAQAEVLAKLPGKASRSSSVSVDRSKAAEVDLKLPESVPPSYLQEVAFSKPMAEVGMNIAGSALEFATGDSSDWVFPVLAAGEGTLKSVIRLPMGFKLSAIASRLAKTGVMVTKSLPFETAFSASSTQAVVTFTKESLLAKPVVRLRLSSAAPGDLTLVLVPSGEGRRFTFAANSLLSEGLQLDRPGSFELVCAAAGSRPLPFDFPDWETVTEILLNPKLFTHRVVALEAGFALQPGEVSWPQEEDAEFWRVGAVPAAQAEAAGARTRLEFLVPRVKSQVSIAHLGDTLVREVPLVEGTTVLELKETEFTTGEVAFSVLGTQVREGAELGFIPLSGGREEGFRLSDLAGASARKVVMKGVYQVKVFSRGQDGMPKSALIEQSYTVNSLASRVPNKTIVIDPGELDRVPWQAPRAGVGLERVRMSLVPERGSPVPVQPGEGLRLAEGKYRLDISLDERRLSRWIVVSGTDSGAQAMINREDFERCELRVLLLKDHAAQLVIDGEVEGTRTLKTLSDPRISTAAFDQDAIFVYAEVSTTAAAGKTTLTAAPPAGRQGTLVARTIQTAPGEHAVVVLLPKGNKVASYFDSLYRQPRDAFVLAKDWVEPPVVVISQGQQPPATAEAPRVAQKRWDFSQDERLEVVIDQVTYTFKWLPGSKAWLATSVLVNSQEDTMPRTRISQAAARLLCRRLNEDYRAFLPAGYVFSLPSVALWSEAAAGRKQPSRNPARLPSAPSRDNPERPDFSAPDPLLKGNLWQWLSTPSMAVGGSFRSDLDEVAKAGWQTKLSDRSEGYPHAGVRLCIRRASGTESPP